MRKISSFIAIAFVASTLFSCSNTTNQENANNETATTNERIVSLNGAVTAIVSELGHEKELVGRDVTSTYPEWVKDSVKDLGHVRSLTMESVMALQPTLILASDADMNPDLKQQIEASGITYKLFSQEYTVDGTKALIQEVASSLNSNDFQPLIDKIDNDLGELEPFEQKPKVLFIYARGAGTLMVAGDSTQMANMIEIAGAQNAVTNMKDFKPLTTESLLNSNPDIILLFDSGLQSIGGVEGLLNIPGIAQTNAGKNKAVITMDGGLLSDFGPRVGEGAKELNRLMHQYAK